METLLKIGGMSCEHCVKHVTEALEGVRGVKSAKVSLKNGDALVKHDDGASLEAMKAALVEAGYEAG
jgi:copper chaperone CopZ